MTHHMLHGFYHGWMTIIEILGFFAGAGCALFFGFVLLVGALWIWDAIWND